MKGEILMLIFGLFLVVLMVGEVSGADFTDETIKSPWINDTYTINYNENNFLTPLVADFEEYHFPERWNCQITRVKIKPICPINALCPINIYNISDYELMKNSSSLRIGFYLAKEGENILQFTCCQYYSGGSECFILDRTFFVIKNYSKISDIQLQQSNQNQRITALESWQQTIDLTIASIQTSITSILNTIAGFTNHDSRIIALENITCPWGINNSRCNPEPKDNCSSMTNYACTKNYNFWYSSKTTYKCPYGKGTSSECKLGACVANFPSKTYCRNGCNNSTGKCN